MRLVIRGVSAGVFLALAGVGAASFELVMAMDRGNTTTQGRIHRYDGDTGTYLGSFAQGWVSSNSTMALSQSLGLITISSSGRLRTFDYNTGEMKRVVSVGGDLAAMASLSTGEVLIAPNGTGLGLLRYNPTNGELNVVSLPVGGLGLVPVISFLATNGNNWYFGDGANNQTWRSGNSGASWTRVSAPAALLAPDLNQAIFSQNVFGDYYFTNRTIGRVQFDFAGGISFVGIDGFSGTTGLAVGHAGKVFALGTTATGAQIQTMDNVQILGFRFNAPQVVNPGYLAAVVAPEPGTLVAVGLGLAALARKRRKR